MTGVKIVDFAKSSGGYYAPATLTSTNTEVLYVSGQSGSTRGGIVPTDHESQIHLALMNLRKIIIFGGVTVKNILKLTLLIVNYDPKQRKHARPSEKFLVGHRPAITLIPVAQLAVPSWLFEIDAVIARPSLKPSIPGQLSLEPADKTVDVVIIGAGLAGLAAATELQRAGRSFIIIEARDRVGGKTWSQPLPDGEQGVVDVGAAWINSTNQSKMYALAKKYGAEILEQNTTGKCVLQDADGKCSTFEYGDLPKFDAATVKDVTRIRDIVEADCQTLDPTRPQNAEWDSVTFEAYLRSKGASTEALATATVWTRTMLGQDPKDISALYFLTYCRSGGGLLQMRVSSLPTSR